VIVVSDTSPLRYLAAVGGMDWLPALFGEVICPPEVIAECLHDRAPSELRAWASSLPPWVRVLPVPVGAASLPVGDVLDGGETAALVLAREIKADLVLIDERKGRAVAARMGLAVTGTIGIWVEAARSGLIEFDHVLERLKFQTNFRVDDAAISAARRRLAGSP
jgi:predicted nucleic acid-binding protein